VGGRDGSDDLPWETTGSEPTLAVPIGRYGAGIRNCESASVAVVMHRVKSGPTRMPGRAPLQAADGPTGYPRQRSRPAARRWKV